MTHRVGFGTPKGQRRPIGSKVDNELRGAGAQRNAAPPSHGQRLARQRLLPFDVGPSRGDSPSIIGGSPGMKPGKEPAAPSVGRPHRRSGPSQTRAAEAAGPVQLRARVAQVPTPTQSRSWVRVDAASLLRPAVPTAGPAPTESVQRGQAVVATIDGEGVQGALAGYDFRGRPVIGRGEGRRIPADWASIVPQGLELEVARPTDGLDARALVRPPEKLRQALDAAFETQVTGPHTAREYVDALHGSGFFVYLTGGAIRDVVRLFTTNPAATVEALAETLKDVDIVTTAPPPAVRRIAATVAPEYPNGAVWSPEIVDQFGSVLIGGPKAGLPNPEGLDVTSMRSDGAFEEQTLHRDTGETAFPYVFDHSLRDDAGSRDFTMNAVYYDPLNGVLVDPTGRGIEDAERGSLRIARAETLAKDDNIALRFWKFRMRGYTADDETVAAIRRNANAINWKAPRWRVANNLARMVPKTARTHAEVATYFEALGQAMKADGCKRLFERRMQPLEQRVADKVVKRIQRAAEAEAKRAAGIGAGVPAARPVEVGP
jgi:tRNA nucleotidyltransferase/poly(A) polymerase